MRLARRSTAYWIGVVLHVIPITFCLFVLWMLTGCANAGTQFALGQSESLVCDGSARIEADGALTCEGELRWVTGGPLSTGFAQAISGARETALRAVGAVVGVPGP